MQIKNDKKMIEWVEITNKKVKNANNLKQITNTLMKKKKKSGES